MGELQYTHIATAGPYKYAISPVGGDDLLVYTISPLSDSGDVDEDRSVGIVRVPDTETGETEYKIILPKMQEGEAELWGGAIRAAAMVITKLTESEGTPDDQEII
jgi:hypothetical protein